MTDSPTTHRQDAQKLTADAYVDLYEVTLRPSGKLYLKTNNDVVWQGRTWEGVPLQLTGLSQSSDEDISRPRLSIVNPMGIFSALVSQGKIDRATINRYRVLKTNVDTNTNIYQRQTWMVGRILSMNSKVIQLELRELSDGPNAIIPARVFAPPEFPAVSLR